jgi:hypothetical protein
MVFYKPDNSTIQYHTKYAKNFFKHQDEKKNVKWIKETQEADGCDSFGPTAIIYYLFIVSYNTQKKTYICEVYSAEERYHENEKVEYEFLKQYESPNYSPVNNWNDIYDYYK